MKKIIKCNACGQSYKAFFLSCYVGPLLDPKRGIRLDLACYLGLPNFLFSFEINKRICLTLKPDKVIFYCCHRHPWQLVLIHDFHFPPDLNISIERASFWEWTIFYCLLFCYFLSPCACCRIQTLDQGILKEEVSLYHWPPVWLVWNQLNDNWQLLFLFAKQTIPNQSNRRSMVQWYFPL